MKRITDEQMDTVIGIILRIGVFIAAAVVAAGGIAYLTHHAGDTVSYRNFSGAGAELRSMRSIVRGAATLDPLFVIQFGLLLLMATPVARVIACVAGFGAQGDRKYIVISLIVLTLLVVSLLGHSA